MSAPAHQELPELLALTDLGPGRYRITQPDRPPEGRDVVFSGQLLAQMIMAADRAAAGDKDVRSVHALFARAGTHAEPIDLDVDAMHAGRTWASDTVTATQDGRLLCRALILLNTVDPDLMRHDPDMPAGVPGPESVAPAPAQAFPGAEVRPVPGELTVGGVPVELAWHRFAHAVPSRAAHGAVVAWATCGNVIGLSMRPHRARVRIEDAHRSLLTGVIGHTIHFTGHFDSSEWLLIVTEGTQASAGRVYGGGRVFTRHGDLVAAFHQDAMAKAAEPDRGAGPSS
jgi:acyl-CoA thioesterase